MNRISDIIMIIVVVVGVLVGIKLNQNTEDTKTQSITSDESTVVVQSESPTSPDFELNEIGAGANGQIHSWIDPQTGIEYLVLYGGRGAVTMTPRLNQLKQPIKHPIDKQ